MTTATVLTRLSALSALLTLLVILLGAYVRLADAGLGCPDWPGCYGHLTVPSTEQAIDAANAAYPERPVETAKAWKEMLHRYLAGILGLMILALAVFAWLGRKDNHQPPILPLLLVGLVIFQALLGMWTVTLLLQPLVVVAHLLGGMTTLALLWWYVLRQSRWLHAHEPYLLLNVPAHLRVLAALGIGIVAMQISLGGWTSANYAALACPDFPTCQHSWLPANMDWSQAFTLWRSAADDHAGNALASEGRIAIHFTHRLGAVLTTLYLLSLSFYLLQLRKIHIVFKIFSGLLATALLLQVSLGIANVIFSLPLGLAVAHNGGAALLLLVLVSLLHLLYQPRRDLRERL